MSVKRCGLDCIKQLIPNLAAAAVQCGVITAATTVGVATGGVILPAGIAAALIAGYMGITYKEAKSGAVDDIKLKAAINLIRQRSADAEQKLDQLGLKLAHRLDRTHQRLNELRDLAEQAGVDHDHILAYLRKHEGLFVSLSEFMEANFDELRPIINVLPARIETLRTDLRVLHNELFVRLGRIEARQDDHSAKLDKIIAFLEPKQSGVDPTTQTVPPDVLEAAQSLINSRSARERAAAAIVLRQWELADKELATLRATPALVEAFEIKTLEGNRYYAAGLFDEAIPHYEAAFHLQPLAFAARSNLAMALSEARRGHAADRQRRAIEIYEGTLKLNGLSCSDWAMTQNNLGSAWVRLPTGMRTDNIMKAIDAYSLALKVRTRKTAPMEWAATQNNLGSAWWNFPAEDRSHNIKKAIDAYSLALEVRTRKTAPVDWARTQNNLGTAWQHYSVGNRADNTTKAIRAFLLALKVLTRGAAPMEWARIQNNLGAAWQHHPGGNPADNFKKAIQAYSLALEVRTRKTAPVDWARTQNNLGTAWHHCPIGNRTDNIIKAIQAFSLALEIRTHGSAPMDWAKTQHHRGSALADLAEQPGQDRCASLRLAISCFKAALLERTAAAVPNDHDSTTQDLQDVRRRYEELECQIGSAGIHFDDILPAE